jgi:predicted aminopeptidase
MVSGCAKWKYVFDQGLGQMQIQFKAQDNDKVLADQNIKQDVKDKIKLVLKFKKYFYEYLDLKETDIYRKTTILDRKAISYLVIISSPYRIKPLSHSFPIVGEFPYLGFFNVADAKDFMRDYEQKDYVTYLRPVYAYSTLNYFQDPIVSSLFEYSDHDLMEIIFHELFHSVFFIKDDVDTNENLANFFSTKLKMEYLNYSATEKRAIEKELDLEKNAYALLAKEIKKLDKIMKRKKFNDPQKANLFFSNYQKKYIWPKFSVEQKKMMSVSDNYLNQAQMAAFMTYEKDDDFLSQYYEKYQFNPKRFFVHLVKMLKDYSAKDDKTFIDYLKKTISK